MPTQMSTPQAKGRWFVTRCNRGCFHVDLGHVQLKLSPREFRSLVTLLGDAYVQFTVEEAALEAEGTATGHGVH